MRIASELFVVAALSAWALPARAGPTKLGPKMKAKPDDEVRRLAADQRRDFALLPSPSAAELETFDRFAFKVEKGQCYAVAMKLDRNDYAVDACTRNGPSATLREPGVKRSKPIDFRGFEQNAFTSCPAKASGTAVLALRFSCRRRTKGKGSLRLLLYGRSPSAHPANAKAGPAERSMIAGCAACKEQLQKCFDRGIPLVECKAHFATCASAITVGGRSLKASDCE